MVPNTLLTPYQSLSSVMNMNLQNNTTSVPVLAPPPVVPPTPKRKRGRPPKPNNFSSKITKTINISVNTSPLSNSPDAENNSNQTVKRGIPDIFTPTMRVSPSAGAIRRRKKSSVDMGNSPARRKSSVHSLSHGSSSSSSQNSPATDYINSRTLDNISQITNSGRGAYQSPPPSAKQQGRQLDKNLLPPVLIRTDRAASPVQDLSDFGDFNLKLMIDESGKAVLSQSQANTTIGIQGHYDSAPTTTATGDLDYGQAPVQYHHHQQQQQQQQQQQRPMPMKYHSDYAFSDTNPPQTPKQKDYTISTGLTPLGFGGNYSTPQFNSLMNSIITSPKKVGNNNNQFMFNQEMFMNSGFDFMNGNPLLQAPQQSTMMQQQQQSPSGGQFNTGSVGANVGYQPQMTQPLQFPDDSDARLALKKIMHVKRI
ncbi:hypothetical protein PSN45_001442 [Yamadazyma tenuis]|uniref:Uncharacterized protein n=1 Tax=Candida tenuis (strain ATCC 10573 / BCRC 21748 / CBS 615 / JCM 9827 / NBRC 10315 / NRRL Y-1498 / VKM Y-70) TaxID=590646 RepID=G3BC21_CANTC|nr:uncharacterized protein CANTEDRAFT_116829 [Yamadazyma tenuis ATCC 10573]EGV60762.1 hypothetical protein CANTEDRAFT_116829 [Yamadazyma tenuis ATCC 10573]WEJ93965.1 hypothetical protein PSN45_001442 [Yamadazyma tenuis]